MADYHDEYWINEDDDKEPDSDDDCDCDLELLRPPAVTTLGLLSQATRTEGVKIKTWMIIEGTVSTGQCDTLKIGIAFSADGSNCLLRLIAWQFRELSFIWYYLWIVPDLLIHMLEHLSGLK
uniref:Uncharacterized protein n=1 Tax=Capitella teleta TaxID=283909 RepID=X1ZSV4_CAPTE